jgi:adenylosuccinate synthase
MSVIAVVGGQWGDEGKGKVIDWLAGEADIVCRFSGGDNAGHTVINPMGEFKLHLIPAGIFYPNVDCIIGNGVVINPDIFLDEKQHLNKRGVSTERLFISDRAHLVMPYHRQIDELEEISRGEKSIGTTKRGIGPAFTDKVARLGIRAGELLNLSELKARLQFVLDYKNLILRHVYGAKAQNPDSVFEKCVAWAKELKPHVKETSAMLETAIDSGKKVLLEGAQGSLLDPDFGTYPYCTSSSPLAGGAVLGTGIGPTAINDVIGVFKAYCTRVGSGPFPTELHDDKGDLIRERAREYGTTTGRPRRCGWFDAVAARFSCRINGFSGIIVTRVDILDSLSTIKICIGYELEGQRLDYFPADASILSKVKPVYEVLNGWQRDTTQIRNYKELPNEAKVYLERLERLLGCKVNLACVGPERAQAIEKIPISGFK